MRRDRSISRYMSRRSAFVRPAPDLAVRAAVRERVAIPQNSLVGLPALHLHVRQNTVQLIERDGLRSDGEHRARVLSLRARHLDAEVCKAILTEIGGHQ